MPKDLSPKTTPEIREAARRVQKSDMPSEAYYSEMIRSALPDIAAPIKPGELLSTWIERAARATGISAPRLRAYWHRRVECPRIPEYVAVVAAAQEAARRQQAIADLEESIHAREEELRTDHDRLARSHPVLVFLAPKPPRASKASEASQARVGRRRAAGGSRG